MLHLECSEGRIRRIFGLKLCLEKFASRKTKKNMKVIKTVKKRSRNGENKRGKETQSLGEVRRKNFEMILITVFQVPSSIQII